MSSFLILKGLARSILAINTRESVLCRQIGFSNRLNNTEQPEISEGEEKPSKVIKEEIPVETSIKYLNSTAYATTYGGEPVWKQYRRNHKGHLAPYRTRKTCIRKGEIATGSPCPICRDEYLVLKPENVKLLKQFLSPFTGETLSYTKTGLCQKSHKNLLIALEIAKDRGLISFDIPFRKYDYSEYQ